MIGIFAASGGIFSGVGASGCVGRSLFGVLPFSRRNGLVGIFLVLPPHSASLATHSGVSGRVCFLLSVYI